MKTARLGVIASLGWIAAGLSTFACSGSSSSSLSPSPSSSEDAGPGVDASIPSDSSTPTSEAGAGDAAPVTDAIVAPADQWTWVDFPESKCASGTPTGIGVNLHPGATDVLIYLEGGGSCNTGKNCWGSADERTAANVDGYDASTFATAKQRKYPILSREPAIPNPFAAQNMVYVPYCTGDLHSGTAEKDLTVDGSPKPTYFWGAHDIDVFLARLVPTFPSVKHIWLAGTSAGGFGSYLTFDRFAKAFAGVRIDVIDDSGPAITPKGATQNASLAYYGFVPPAGCSPCTTYAGVLASARQAQPASKYAFLSYAMDKVISKDMGYTIDEYPAVIDAFTSTLTSDPNAKSFVVTGVQSHVVQSNPALALQYLPWFKQMVDDDPAWTSTTIAGSEAPDGG